MRTAEEGCAQWYLLCGLAVHIPEIEKSHHLKPTMIKEKNVGCHNHDLETFLLHPNLTLLDKNAGYPTKACAVRNTKTPTVRNARQPTWTGRSHPMMRNRSTMTSRPGG